MTDRQKELLSKYLDDRNMQKLLNMDKQSEYNVSKNFIDLILHMRWYHQICGEMCHVPYFTETPNKEEKEKIESIINQNKKQFGLLADEYASVEEKDFLDDAHVWYVVKQQWYKGMSETPTTRKIRVKFIPSSTDYCSKCIPFENIYNELFDMGIFSLVDLMDFYYGKAKKARE